MDDSKSPHCPSSSPPDLGLVPALDLVRELLTRSDCAVIALRDVEEKVDRYWAGDPHDAAGLAMDAMVTIMAAYHQESKPTVYDLRGALDDIDKCDDVEEDDGEEEKP